MPKALFGGLFRYIQKESAPRGDVALPFYSKEIYSIDDFILWDISHM